MISLKNKVAQQSIWFRRSPLLSFSAVFSLFTPDQMLIYQSVTGSKKKEFLLCTLVWDVV